MKIKFAPVLILSFFTLVFNTNFAQNQSIDVLGTVVESQNQQPVEFATVMIGDAKTRQPITGTTTDLSGAFSIKTESSDIYVEISFIGFQTKTINEIEINNGKIDLGTIQISTDAQTLDEVVVRAEKSSTEFKLDKRVFNVGKDLSSTGASALEVLNNVPSVNVNIEGVISLRGSSGVQILINGKPSVLASEQGKALGTITAEMIEKIEVITNPSAKYDAEGTSGIINIVIKKEEREGLNGSVSVNTGIPHNHSIGLSLNRRTEKFNLFSQLGAGYRELPRTIKNFNTDLINETSVESDGTEYRNEQFYNLILGADYHVNKYNVLTLSGFFAYEIEDQPSLINFGRYDKMNDLLSQWYRDETTEATNPKYQYEFQYKKDFKDSKDHTFLFSALGNFFGKKQSSEFENTDIVTNETTPDLQTRTEFKEAKYTFKMDYTKPFSESITMETGAQYVIQNVSNDYEVKDYENGEWIQNPDLTNIFEYDQKVLGVYGTGAYEKDKLGVKLGLRVENTLLNTFLITTNQSNKQNYTNLFPTVHTSYKIAENLSLQAGYSRRIFRPRLWDLNPFFNIRNSFNIRTGNPELQPEFTDSYEIMSIYVVGDLSLNFGIYYRYTTDVIERISTFEDNINVFKPENIGTNQATGVELNFKYSPKKWLAFNGDVNYNYFNRKGTHEATSFDFSDDQWTTKVTAKVKLPAKIEFEITGHYQSSYRTVQNVFSDNIFADMGLRKKIMNGKGVINLSIRDIFASRIREGESFQPTFYLYHWQQRGRFITLGFSYGFGKGEAMEYSGRRRH